MSATQAVTKLESKGNWFMNVATDSTVIWRDPVQSGNWRCLYQVKEAPKSELKHNRKFYTGTSVIDLVHANLNTFDHQLATLYKLSFPPWSCINALQTVAGTAPWLYHICDRKCIPTPMENIKKSLEEYAFINFQLRDDPSRKVEAESRLGELRWATPPTSMPCYHSENVASLWWGDSDLQVALRPLFWKNSATISQFI